MPKISSYPAGSPSDIDQFVTARSGANKSITGNAIGTGWIEVTETWTYASPTTANVPTNATTKYQRGMKIRLKQGGAYKNFYMVTVAATLVTMIGMAGDTLSNAPITDIAFSAQEYPLGAPNRFIQSGTEVITCTSGATNVTATITFPVAFLAAPLVFFSPGPSGNFTLAEMPIIVRGDTLSATQVGVLVRTTDGGTWAANRTLNLQWLAIGT